MPSIKKAVDSYSVSQLKDAELALLEGKPINIEIEGADEAEQLTHILAALFVKDKMASEGCKYVDAIRAFSQKVRTSIS